MCWSSLFRLYCSLANFDIGVRIIDGSAEISFVSDKKDIKRLCFRFANDSFGAHSLIFLNDLLGMIALRVRLRIGTPQLARLEAHNSVFEH